MILFAIFTPGPFEIGIICIVAVLLFGRQLPKVAKSIGSAIPEFRKGLKGIDDELKDTADVTKKALKDENGV
jgi:sec-independent protein translocase protein TatA